MNNIISSITGKVINNITESKKINNILKEVLKNIDDMSKFLSVIEYYNNILSIVSSCKLLESKEDTL